MCLLSHDCALFSKQGKLFVQQAFLQVVNSNQPSVKSFHLGNMSTTLLLLHKTISSELEKPKGASININLEVAMDIFHSFCLLRSMVLKLIKGSFCKVCKCIHHKECIDRVLIVYIIMGNKNET